MEAMNKSVQAADFEALTFEFQLGSAESIDSEGWNHCLTDFLEDLSARITALPGCIPGHFKLCAMLEKDADSTMKLSSLGLGIPVTSDGHFDHAGGSLFLVLNLLLAGVSKETVQGLTIKALGRICGKYDLALAET